jgi:hypothetical protein
LGARKSASGASDRLIGQQLSGDRRILIEILRHASGRGFGGASRFIVPAESKSLREQQITDRRWLQFDRPLVIVGSSTDVTPALRQETKATVGRRIPRLIPQSGLEILLGLSILLHRKVSVPAVGFGFRP